MARSASSDLVSLESPAGALPPAPALLSPSSPVAAVAVQPGLGTSASAIQLQQFLDSAASSNAGGGGGHSLADRPRSLLQPAAAPGHGNVSSSSPNIASANGSTTNSSAAAAAAIGAGSSSSSPSPIGPGTGPAEAAATGTGPELDTYSTDSSTFDEDVKRRRRKLHFPFGKKFSKSKKAQ